MSGTTMALPNNDDNCTTDNSMIDGRSDFNPMDAREVVQHLVKSVVVQCRDDAVITADNSTNQNQSSEQVDQLNNTEDDADWVRRHVTMVASEIKGAKKNVDTVDDCQAPPPINTDDVICKIEIDDSAGEELASDVSSSSVNDDSDENEDDNVGCHDVIANKERIPTAVELEKVMAGFQGVESSSSGSEESDEDTEENNSQSNIGQNTPKMMAYPKHCAMCRSAGVKYTCPGCQRRFCGAKCSEGHKTAYFCAGVRDPTKLRLISSFTQLDYLNDMRFIEAAVRFKQDSSRKLVELNRGPEGEAKDKKSKHGMMQAANRNQIRLITQPKSFERHRRNNSFFEQFAETMFWTIQWTFMDVEGTVVVQDRIPDSVTIGTLLKNVVHPRIPSDRNPALAPYLAEGLERYSVLMAAEQTGWFDQKSYYLMSAGVSLKDNLRQTVVVEHPCFRVVHQKDLDTYLIVTQEVRTARLRKLLWEKPSEEAVPVDSLSYDDLLDKVCNFDSKCLRDQKRQGSHEAYLDRKENIKKQRVDEKNKRKQEKELKKKAKEEKKQAFFQKRRDRQNSSSNGWPSVEGANRNLNNGDGKNNNSNNNNYSNRRFNNGHHFNNNSNNSTNIYGGNNSNGALGPMFDSSVFHGGQIRPSTNIGSLGQFVRLPGRNTAGSSGGAFRMSSDCRPPVAFGGGINWAQPAPNFHLSTTVPGIPSGNTGFAQNSPTASIVGRIGAPIVTPALSPFMNTSVPPPNLLPCVNLTAPAPPVHSLPYLSVPPPTMAQPRLDPVPNNNDNHSATQSRIRYPSHSSSDGSSDHQVVPPIRQPLIADDSFDAVDGGMSEIYQPPKDAYLQKYGTPRTETPASLPQTRDAVPGGHQLQTAPEMNNSSACSNCSCDNGAVVSREVPSSMFSPEYRPGPATQVAPSIGAAQTPMLPFHTGPAFAAPGEFPSASSNAGWTFNGVPPAGQQPFRSFDIPPPPPSTLYLYQHQSDAGCGSHVLPADFPLLPQPSLTHVPPPETPPLGSPVPSSATRGAALPFHPNPAQPRAHSPFQQMDGRWNGPPPQPPPPMPPAINYPLSTASSPPQSFNGAALPPPEASRALLPHGARCIPVYGPPESGGNVPPQPPQQFQPVANGFHCGFPVSSQYSSASISNGKQFTASRNGNGYRDGGFCPPVWQSGGGPNQRGSFKSSGTNGNGRATPYKPPNSNSSARLSQDTQRFPNKRGNRNTVPGGNAGFNNNISKRGETDGFNGNHGGGQKRPHNGHPPNSSPAPAPSGEKQPKKKFAKKQTKSTTNSSQNFWGNGNGNNGSNGTRPPNNAVPGQVSVSVGGTGCPPPVDKTGNDLEPVAVKVVSIKQEIQPMISPSDIKVEKKIDFFNLTGYSDSSGDEGD